MKISTSIALTGSNTEFVELSDIERFDDGSGYVATLRIGSGDFACSGRKFYFEELPSFLKSLKKAYAEVRGHAELRQPYEEPFIRFEFASRGRLTVSGLLIDHGPPTQKLEFGFEVDQSYLPPLITSLEQAVTESR